MSYTKTNWQNNVTDIDETNLNKIEQGIYNNSLVADAVNSTVKPSESALAEATEITEGQMTNVLGIADIKIKGQTEQDGTPTPSVPVDVNVVSGSNVIKTNNKNFFDKNTVVQGDWNNPNSSTSLVLYLGKISEGDKFTASNYNSRRFAFIISNMPIQSNQASALQSSGNQTATQSTFTATANGYVFFKITKTDGSNITPSEINSNDFQIEKGSTSTTYEPHQCKELPLDLPVENLFNIKKITENTAITDAGKTVTSSVSNLSDYIKVKHSTSYTITYDYSSLLNESQRSLCFYNEKKEFITGDTYIATNKTNTFLTPNNGVYIRFAYDKNCVDIKIKETNPRHRTNRTMQNRRLSRLFL